ncbi:MAG: 1,2-epoxyphenylacetyl-CoA isomerase [Gemmatimonadaceae bacterium]|nr:1,2-epoxyphenylacetyl-CoA isomerase [Gemmatimonadaceae bacterium]
MNSNPVIEHVAQGVLTLTLNRPDVLNSFNGLMASALQTALHDAARDAAIRCVLLTGAGRGFCAGQDLAALALDEPAGVDVGGIVRAQYNPILRAIWTMEKPVICAVNGVAAGAGANLALACDVVVASTDAYFVQSFAGIGLIPDSGGTWILPRLVGAARAMALMLLGEKLPATTAQEWGMIYRTFEPAVFREQAMALAVRLAAMPTRGIGLTKRAVNLGLEQGIDAQLETEATIQTEAGRTHDFGEGVRAFQQKRKPTFTGT